MTSFSISFQTYAKTIPPIKFGIKKIVLNIVFPFTFEVNKYATTNAITLIITTTRDANNSVKKNE